ncbi:cell wall-binding repeat-containing protein [Clostridium cochlearium]|uniref:cell wall-binding repeat-containing protein n=1 Tax=Clostridium cochlearium TaxID=1494 RepID=UPI001EDDE7C9|nr:cell wall-binding repeat-containing protein [Clostridium cochlearium]MBV1818603.1 cell wall-binding repeat-containing protein [Bacteroidales bacterium MSK.15.36]MCG4572588.1 cell wall-binding repeat-containing protein [Clostridium cochlearium]
MEKELAKNYKVERIGGNTRYETNAEIAKKVLVETKAEKAILVNGQDGYADALSVASIAATKGYPVIFGNKNNVPSVVKDAIKNVKEVLAVGGEGVLPEVVLKDIKAKRIAKGTDRFDTNLEVLEYFKGDFKFDNIFVAAGGDDGKSKFADALVASAAAAKYGAPVVLTGLGANKENTDKSIKYIKGKMVDKTKVTIVGGISSISESIEKEFKGEKEVTGKAEVKSVEAINLNQIKVVFDTKIHFDTAKDVTNYELDGVRLSKETAMGVSKDGGILITLAKGESQEKEKTLKIRKGVLTDDKAKFIKQNEFKVKFKDLTPPTIKKVEATSSKKVVIEFSEAIFVAGKDKNEALEILAEQLEINGETIDEIGFDNSLSKLKNSVKAKETNKDGFYTDKVEYYLEEALAFGTNKLYVPNGKNGQHLSDAAGWSIKENTIDFKVKQVTGEPTVKSIKGGTDGKIYIEFDREIDKESLKQCKIILNNSYEIQGKAKLEKSDTQIKIEDVTNIRTGLNSVEISNKLKDAYGNKIKDEIRVTFIATKDETKPEVKYVLTSDDHTIKVVYNKDVLEDVARNIGNYTLKDSKGNKIEISNVQKVSKDIYNVITKEKLDALKYTLEIKNTMDASGNIIDDYTTTINGAKVTPVVSGVINMGKDGKGERIAILFGQEMKSSTINKIDSYKFKDGEGKIRNLPEDTDIIVSKDGKVVRLELPEAYVVKEKGKNIDSKVTSKIVTAIIVKDSVESVSGIKMGVDETQYIKASSATKVKISAEPMTLKKDRDNVIVELKYTGSIDKVENKDKFKFKAGDKEIIADRVTVRGDFIEFRFKSSDEDLIERAGVDLQLIGLGKVIDFAGQTIAQENLKENKFKGIYHNEIAPELLYEKNSGYINVKKGNKAGNNDWAVNVSEGKITVKFNTKIDKSSTYKDSFTFISDKSSTLKVKSGEVKDNTIIYTLTDESKKGLQKVGEHEIIVIPEEDSERIESKEDKDGNSKKFKPLEKSEKLKFRVNVKEEDIK